MKIIYKIICFLFIPFLIEAQTEQYETGLHIVRNYTPKEYIGFSQNWGCVQDSRGILYFANGDGVLEYDGVHWRIIDIAHNYTASAICIDKNNNIYVGSSSEFGFLAPMKKGDIKYISLMNYFEPKLRKFDFIEEIYSVSSGIYFKAGQYLFHWHDSSMKKWKIGKDRVLKYKDNIVIWAKEGGFKYMKNDSIVTLFNDKFFSDKAVRNIFSYKNNRMLIVTRDSGMYIVSNLFKLKKGNDIEIKKFNNQADVFIKHYQLLKCSELTNGYYAFSTLRGGTIIINDNGLLVQILDNKSGIQNETHYRAEQDKQNTLWLSLDNGISRVDISSPISFWNDETGLKGGVLSIIRFKGRIFVGTWQGLFYHDYTPDKYLSTEYDLKADLSQFKPLNINTQTWDFLIVKNEKNSAKDKLLAVSSDGIYDVSFDKCNLIEDGVITKIIRSKKDPSKIYIANEKELLSYSIMYSGDEIIFKNKEVIYDLNEKILSLAEDSLGNIWVSTIFSGVYRISLNNTSLRSLKNKYNITEFDTSSGVSHKYTYIYKFGKKLLFISEDGVYSPIKIKKKNGNKDLQFVRDNFYTKTIFKGLIYINQFVEDKKGNIWLQITEKKSDKRAIVCIKKQKNGTYTFISNSFKLIPAMELYSIYPESNNVTWFGGDDGLYRYDGNIKYTYNQEFNALIRKVILERDSVIFLGTFYNNVNDSGECSGISLNQPENLIPIIRYRYNNITFEFAAPNFYDEKSNQFKIYLEGFDKEWSDWSYETKKEYTNLPPGKYAFHVISKNMFDKESTEAVYKFEILYPWYRTYIAYVFYFFIFIFIIYVAIRYSNKRLRDAKLRLEDIIKDRTSEINNQKKEIEKEKEKSDKLLLNILPFKLAEELKEHGSAKAKLFNHVTVMFSDFKDFTIIAQQLEPQELISVLSRCFVFFDDVCVRHNIEKIKTVGDSYMCAGGVPIKNKTNPVDTVLASFEMCDFIKKLKKEQSNKGMALWKIRIGIHTGTVISGVVGKKKFAYDIWGDTVNTANRLEQASIPNKINISGYTYEFVKDFFECTYRGKVPVKHKGEIDMYFADGIKKELSVDDNGKIPNQKFWELYEKISANNTNSFI